MTTPTDDERLSKDAERLLGAGEMDTVSYVALVRKIAGAYLALRAEVERLTREGDGARESAHYAGGVADLAMLHRDDAESALAAERKRSEEMEALMREVLETLDKLDPAQAVMPVQQSKMRAALASGTSKESGT